MTEENRRLSDTSGKSGGTRHRNLFEGREEESVDQSSEKRVCLTAVLLLHRCCKLVAATSGYDESSGVKWLREKRGCKDAFAAYTHTRTKRNLKDYGR